jgi:hypothetical protein
VTTKEAIRCEVDVRDDAFFVFEFVEGVSTVLVLMTRRELLVCGWILVEKIMVSNINGVCLVIDGGDLMLMARTKNECAC